MTTTTSGSFSWLFRTPVQPHIVHVGARAVTNNAAKAVSASTTSSVVASSTSKISGIFHTVISKASAGASSVASAAGSGVHSLGVSFANSFKCARSGVRLILQDKPQSVAVVILVVIGVALFYLVRICIEKLWNRLMVKPPVVVQQEMRV
jgi:hypothetical protein